MQTPALAIPSVGAYLSGNSYSRARLVSDRHGHQCRQHHYRQLLGRSTRTWRPRARCSACAVRRAGRHHRRQAYPRRSDRWRRNHANDISVIVSAPAHVPPSTDRSQRTLLPLQPIQHRRHDPTRRAAPDGSTHPPSTRLVASPVSNLAFITYNGSQRERSCPTTCPAPTGRPARRLCHAHRRLAVTAPIAGAFTPDDSSSLSPRRATT